MKIEKTLFKISILETISISIFMLIILNGVIFLISLLTGSPRFFFYETAWILQIVFPFIFAITQTSINRNGVLKITDLNDVDIIKNKIDLLIQKRGLIKTVKDLKLDSYTKKTKWGRFFNLFFREVINVNYSKGEILIFGKRNMLSLIESKLRFDKEFYHK